MDKKNKMKKVTLSQEQMQYIMEMGLSCFKNCMHPPWYFYSPIFMIKEVKAREDAIWKGLESLETEGIDLRSEEQVEYYNMLSETYFHEAPFSMEEQEGVRFHENTRFAYGDAMMLYAVIRHHKPKHIIEAGSGYSSAVMLDTNEKFFNNEIKTTFVEPYPSSALDDVLKEEDRKNATVIEECVQTVDLDVFSQLEAGDILFIDSSHVSKTGSDVNFLFFDVFPKLPSGVLIHLHDIFHSFEYPKDWCYKGRQWNELYLLRAFLSHNNQYKINFFGHYLSCYQKQCASDAPKLTDAYLPTSSFWMEKL